jgi:hypothetical protein
MTDIETGKSVTPEAPDLFFEKIELQSLDTAISAAMGKFVDLTEESELTVLQKRQLAALNELREITTPTPVEGIELFKLKTIPRNAERAHNALQILHAGWTAQEAIQFIRDQLSRAERKDLGLEQIGKALGSITVGGVPMEGYETETVNQLLRAKESLESAGKWEGMLEKLASK